MNIAVCINHVPDTTTKIKIAEHGDHIDASGVSFILNPYDEFAIEEALRLKEKTNGIVYLLCLGKDDAKESIRKGLALGADEGILLKSEQRLDAGAVAEALAGKIKELQCSVVFTGKQSIDFDDGIVGQMIAELLDYQCVSICVSLSIEGEHVTAERECEGGKEVIETTLPVVITAQKGLNEPRYASLKGIMASKKKTITEVNLPELQTRTLPGTLKPIAQKSPGRILGSDAAAAHELVSILHDEIKII